MSLAINDPSRKLAFTDFSFKNQKTLGVTGPGYDGTEKRGLP